MNCHLFAFKIQSLHLGRLWSAGVFSLVYIAAPEPRHKHCNIVMANHSDREAGFRDAAKSLAVLAALLQFASAIKLACTMPAPVL